MHTPLLAVAISAAQRQPVPGCRQKRHRRSHCAPRLGRASGAGRAVEAVQVLLAVAVPEMPAPEHIKKLLESFQRDLKEWRTDLARVRMAREQNPPLPDPDLRTHFPKPTGQSKVTGDINHSRGKILLCLYLFVTLAPVDSAVTRTSDMNDLLDAVFGPRKDLPTHYRRLLQKAGACLENVKSTYRVDTDERREIGRASCRERV